MGKEEAAMWKRICIGLMLLLMSGCGKGREAAQVLTGFLEAVQQGHYDEAYAMLAADDRNEMPEFVYIHKLSGLEKSIQNPPPAKTSFRIKGMKKARGGKEGMIADVRVTVPDMAAIEALAHLRTTRSSKIIPKVTPPTSPYSSYQDYAQAMETEVQIYQREVREEIEKQMTSILDGGTYPTTTIKKAYYLIQEGEQWRVLLNLKGGGNLW